MDTKQICSAIEKSGLKIGKDKILELLRKSLEKELQVMKDSTSSHIIIKLKSH